MPDIFISYKKEERAVASQLATRLTEAGYDVWWDAALLAGDRFEDEIASVLRASRAVIVLWSKRSVESDWVKAEAESARAQKKALPAVIDDVPMDNLPLLFRGLHVVRLDGWAGDPAHQGYGELMASVAERLGAAEGPALSAPQAEAKLAQSVSEAEVWSAIAASTDPSAAEYRAYLKRFGTSARFAELAEIRIARLEEREGERKVDIKRIRRKWAPAIVLPLIALLIIAGAGGWMWQRGDLKWVRELFIPQTTKDAAQHCTDWSKSGKLEWPTTFPALDDNAAADCELAKDTWPDNADYKAMLAMARVVQGPERADDGIALARQSIDAGSALGNYVLGVMYNYHLNLTTDLNKAASYYKEAYRLGSADAAGRLCYMAEDHGLTLPYLATSSEIYDLCAASSDKGSAIGQAMMGYIYEQGDFGKDNDHIKAAEFYEKSAAQGNPFAKVQLGSVLIRGNGIKHDPDRAATLFEEAKSLGHPAAMRWLAIAHELGIGVAVDIPRAGQLYYEAIDRGDPVAFYLLGFLPPASITYGDLTRREIIRLYREVTPLGHRMLGVMQQYGIDGPVSNAAAFANFTSCVEISPFCQFVLGSFHRFGPPQYSDYARAAELTQRAADAGEVHAEYQLAQFYEYGDGVPVDLARARELYQLALAHGYREAGEDLYRLAQAGSATSQ
jgi:TPR repeat protein